MYLYDIFTLAILMTGYFHVLKIKETIQARVSVALVVSALSTFVTYTVVAYVIEFEELLFHLSGILYICLPMLAGLKWHKEIAMFCISPFGK
ncbi:hypothetical protein X474_18045 [Dethiosulfatarculus sandiegensis]|uniref:Uncharacterized protein n=1 Tax=Dethiosulfatarculus sandiegensis TaxID=1429043 RepID=A0A0D2GCJ6_9BACT|nr:hypothetical protein X474_18045 [Dethiosulfatarculus sandiegensis]